MKYGLSIIKNQGLTECVRKLNMKLHLSLLFTCTLSIGFQLSHHWHDLQATPTCSSYKCAPINYPMPGGFCVQLNNNIYYTKACTSLNMTDCNTSLGMCQPPAVASAELAYPGEKCKLNSDCVYGNCLAFLCRGLGAGVTCVTHEQCDSGLYCSIRGICTPQLAPTSTGCRSLYDCKNYAGCNMTYSSDNGICVAYASLPINSYVTDCRNGFSQMCASGTCVSSGWLGNLGKCVTAPISVGTMPVSCTNYIQCQGTDGNRIYLSNCVCAYSQIPMGFCMPFIGDLPGTRLINA